MNRPDDDAQFEDAAFEARLEHELRSSAAVVVADLERALGEVRGPKARSGSSRPLLAVAAALAVIAGGVLAADRLGSDSERLIVGPAAEVATTLAPVTTLEEVPVTGLDEYVDPDDLVPAEDGSTRAVGLDGGGLLSINPANGVIIALPFGIDAQSAVDPLVMSFGEPSSRGASDECGPGPLEFVQWGSLTLSILPEAGTLARWTLTSAQAGPIITTIDGLGIGTTVAELRAARPGAVFEEDSLGWEYFDGFSWFASGPADTDTVEAMLAGETCVAR